MSAPIVPSPKLMIEGAFAAFILRTANGMGCQVVRASDSDVEVVAPYVMCWAESVESRANGFYVARMQIILVTNMDDTTTGRRADLAGQLFAALRTETPFIDGSVAVLGWSPPLPKEASSNQEKGDGFAFTAGVQVAG